MLFGNKKNKAAGANNSGPVKSNNSTIAADRGVSGHAKYNPESIALIDSGCVVTYLELDARTNAIASALKRLGVSSGDRIITCLETAREQVETSVAAAKLDLLYVPINPRSRVDEMVDALRELNPAAIVTTDRLWSKLTTDYPDLLATSALLTVCEGERLRSICAPGKCEKYQLAIGRPEEEIESFSANHGARLGIYKPSSTVGGRGGLQETDLSGSGVALAQEAHLSLWNWNSDDVYLFSCGSHHPGPGGWAQAALHVGAAIVLMDDWDPTVWLEMVENHGVTRSFLTPGQMRELADMPEESWKRFDLSSLVSVVHGGAQCPIAVKLRAIEKLSPAEVWEIYGSSDRTVARISSSDWISHPGSVGKPQPDVKVEVVGMDSKPVRIGQRGLVKWTANSYQSNGKIHSIEGGGNHVGYIDSNGYLFITDRAGDAIGSGKNLVYPWEIEEVIHGLSGVEDCVVFGLDPRTGKAGLIALVRAPGCTAEEIIVHCRRYLPETKCPTKVVLTDRVYRDQVGKVNRGLLGAAFTAGIPPFSGFDGAEQGLISSPAPLEGSSGDGSIISSSD